MKRKGNEVLLNFLVIIQMFLTIYVLSYIWIRNSHTEVADHDGETVVVFQEQQKYLYYSYSPLIFVDKAITKIKFSTPFIKQ
jgi:hypothetical protein